MMSEAQLLAHFQAMAACSAKMRCASQQADWDALAEQERALVHLRQTQPVPPESMAALSGDAQAHVRALIMQMLEDDAEVRSHVMPWLGSTRRYLASLNQGSKMQNAYAALDRYQDRS
jgi:flagellar protein FliT